MIVFEDHKKSSLIYSQGIPNVTIKGILVDHIMFKACDNCGIGHTTSLSLLMDHFEGSKYVECARKTGEQQQQQF